jgi:non-specific serine/threonine protein kinase
MTALLLPTTAAIPAQVTTFIGREHEVAAVRSLLDSARLVTLTGAGGSGKTRVAAEVARSLHDRRAEGVAWIELAALTDRHLLTTHIAATLGVGNIGQSPADALREALRDADTVLVLDNCEHLVTECAAFAETLLRDCPHVRILATSREALGVPGERAWLVPVLSLPPAEADSSAISHSSAVRLFVDRAQSASRSFELTTANAAAVAQLCRRLDGLPLAIELVAARARTLTAEQTLAQLDNGLLDERHTTPGRHRTLRQTIDWSYNLLDPREQRVFQRLSVFAGEFSLDAAEAVCAAADVDSADVLDLIAALADKSLLAVRDQADEARYHLLETIRQYGQELLDATPNGTAARARHAYFFADLIAQAEPHLITPRRPEWVARLQRELDDIRLALAWTYTHEPARHIRMAGQLGWFWYSSGLWTEGRRRLEDALALGDARARGHARASLLFAAGVIASLQGHGATARTWLEESSAIAAEQGDSQLVAYSDSYIGIALGQEGLPAAEAPTRAALAWFDNSGDLYGQRLALVVLATILIRQGNLDAAKEVAQRAVRIARAYGLGRELGIALQVLGTTHLHRRELVESAASLADALRALLRDPQPFWLARALELSGLIECVRGRPLNGARLFGAAEAGRERIGAVMFRLDRDRLAPHIDAGRERAGDAFTAAWNAGRTLTFEQAAREAITNATDPSLPIRELLWEPPAMVDDAPLLRVKTLGTVEIEREGKPLTGDTWKHARVRELLVYLVVHPDGRTREQIGADFWPDASPAQVKNSFHVLLHHLRRALGRSDLIVYESDSYRMNWPLGIEVDARTFERESMDALRAHRLQPDSSATLQQLRIVADLYRGDFLESESVGDWHLAIRERLQRLWVDAVQALGSQLLMRGANDEAADLFRRLVRVDELDENAHRLLLMALARAGQRGEALRHYERFVALLERELGASPEKATSVLHDRLRRAEPV